MIDSGLRNTQGSFKSDFLKSYDYHVLRRKKDPFIFFLQKTGVMKTEFIERIVTCSNFYAENGGKGGAVLLNAPMQTVSLSYYLIKFIYVYIFFAEIDICQDDWTKFLTAIMFFSQSKLPHLRDYWFSPLYSSSTICSLIDYSRFRSILSSIHVEKVNVRQTSQNFAWTKSDPLWRIRWLFDFFNTCWGSLYEAGIFLSLDEAIIPTKIRHILRQYIKGKPHKWGFKLYVLACPSSGLAVKILFHDRSRDMVNILDTVVTSNFQFVFF